MREQMLKLLEERVVPRLRNLGFKGSFPHFHRVRSDHVDLLSFQFGSAGGSFVVELSYADSDRQNIAEFFRDLAPADLRGSHAKHRYRLGSEADGGDFWYAFEGKRPFGMSGTPEQCIEAVLKNLETNAIPWWESKSAMNAR